MKTKPIVIAGALLLIAGLLALAYGGFSYTSDVHDAKLGPIEFRVEERDRVNVPAWAGTGAAVLGGILVAVGLRRA